MMSKNELVQNATEPQYAITQTDDSIGIRNPEAVKKSLEIMSKFDYIPQYTQNISHYECQQCHTLFPVNTGKDCSCKFCSGNFCLRHRDVLNHNCRNITPNHQKYLMAKNAFKLKMKEMKHKIR